MAYEEKNLSLVAQGPRKIWMHVSGDALAKDADDYFVDVRPRQGDLIIDHQSSTSAAQILVVATNSEGAITVADLQSGNLT